MKTLSMRNILPAMSGIFRGFLTPGDCQENQKEPNEKKSSRHES